MSSSLPSEWIFDGPSPDQNVVRVVAISPSDAAAIPDARAQVTRLAEGLFERAGLTAARAQRSVGRAFEPPEGPAALSYTVLVYVDPSPSKRSDAIIAFTGVASDDERVIISSIAVDDSLPQDKVAAIGRAITTATEDLALKIAREHQVKTSVALMIWRGQLGASDELKQQYKEHGYSESLTERLEMTVQMKDVDVSDAVPVPSGFNVRALDLANDDLVAVFDVLKMAFGASPPPFAAWKQHYPQQPRFAADMSFVAWENGKPVAVSLIELMVDGEGGGDDELGPLYKTAAQLSEATAATEVTDLQFPDDFEERKTKIRAAADTGYVCGIATVPEMRGKGLARTLLRHNFRAAARAGLSKIYLGTDRHNPAAVRAYERAGMAVTKMESGGLVTAKFYAPEP